MNFDLTEEQRMLKDSVDRWIAENYSFEQRGRHMKCPGGWNREVWAQYAELGLLGIPFDEAEGGLGGGPIETMLVMEAFGRGLTLEPYLATVVLAGGLLRLAGSASQRRTLVPQIADGRLTSAFAHSERHSRFEIADVSTTARLDEKGWTLDGEKTAVLHGDSADKLIISARTSGSRCDAGGITLFLVAGDAKGIARRGYATQDGFRAADIQLHGVRVSPEDVLGEPGSAYPVIARVVDEAIAALCAEALGAMAALHELTVEYLKNRRQFGVPIGSFQVLQHRAVDMLIALEQARSMAMLASMSVAEDDAELRGRRLAAAKAQIGSSCRFIGQEATQLHGGMGLTLEYSGGHYFKRLTMIESLFGNTAHQLQRLARAGGVD
ncbi:MAG: acyl-CoA dehydrogenase family protein [Betaproteobacteria bacterium]|nr:acyl-CoA dehydrogenase family protein [Betaproteobacteria bacterium]